MNKMIEYVWIDGEQYPITLDKHGNPPMCIKNYQIDLEAWERNKILNYVMRQMVVLEYTTNMETKL